MVLGIEGGPGRLETKQQFRQWCRIRLERSKDQRVLGFGGQSEDCGFSSKCAGKLGKFSSGEWHGLTVENTLERGQIFLFRNLCTGYEPPHACLPNFCSRVFHSGFKSFSSRKPPNRCVLLFSSFSSNATLFLFSSRTFSQQNLASGPSVT